MEKPRLAVSESAGPRTALKAMREGYSSAVYVTGRDHKLLGMVRDRDAMKLVQKGERSLASVIRPVPQSVEVDAVLMDLFVPSVESPLPLAVVNSDGRLVGVIPRVTLLAALGPGDAATGEIVIPVPAAEIDELLATAPGVADEASATEAKETR